MSPAGPNSQPFKLDPNSNKRSRLSTAWETYGRLPTRRSSCRHRRIGKAFSLTDGALRGIMGSLLNGGRSRKAS